MSNICSILRSWLLISSFSVGREQGLPIDLETIPPGLMLMLVLSSVDREALSGFDRVELVKARSRLIAHLQAELLADVESVSEATGELGNLDQPDPDQIFETTVSELRAALCLTRRSAELMVDLAFQLNQRLPQVWAALHAGLIDLGRARVLCDQTGHLPRELAQQVCDRALDRAPEQTTGQLRARMQRLIISIDPASARERYEEKLKDRRVISEMTDDGTANLLGLDLPPADANAAMRRINRLARSLKSKGDPREHRPDPSRHPLGSAPRSWNQQNRLRPRNSRSQGRPDHPGRSGRETRGDPRLGTSPRRYRPTDRHRTTRIGVAGHHHRSERGAGRVATTKRRPTAIQKRRIQTRNPTCVFPGCRIPANQCDLDHHQAWKDGGPTSTNNLGPLCRHDHRAKHEHGWKLNKPDPASTSGPAHSATPTPSNPKNPTHPDRATPPQYRRRLWEPPTHAPGPTGPQKPDTP